MAAFETVVCSKWHGTRPTALDIIAPFPFPSPRARPVASTGWDGRVPLSLVATKETKDAHVTSHPKRRDDSQGFKAHRAVFFCWT